MHTTAPPRHNAATAPSAACTPPARDRYDGYMGIHKALRLFMTDTLTRIGRTDPGDDVEVSATLAQVRELLGLCELHVKDENDFLHPAMERARPGSAARAQQEHVQHLEAIHDLADLAGLIADTRGAARDTALARLYRAMALFVAENFEHMLIEETRHNAALWAHYSDAELAALHDALLASIPPHEMMTTLRWLVPHMAHGERCALLADMRAHAPAPAFEAALGVVRPHLSERDWGKLVQSLGLPA